MVAPLIVGTARVVGGTSKAVTRSKHKSKIVTQRTESPRNIRTGRGRGSEEFSTENERRTQTKNSNQPTKSSRVLNSIFPEKNDSAEKIKAVAASATILWGVVPFYIPQLMFYFLGLAGLGFEAIPVAEWFLPGTELFFFAYIMIVIIGLLAMIYAALVYSLRGVNCFGGTKALVFMCCLTGYFTIFANFIPFVLLYIWAVVSIQKKTSDE